MALALLALEAVAFAHVHAQSDAPASAQMPPGAQTSAQTIPPAVSGVRLGSTTDEVRRTLGAPDSVQESIGMRFWDYQRRGITVIWHEGDPGVRGMVITRAAAGPLRGVRVGDTDVALTQGWGPPARVRQEGRFEDFVDARWVLSAELRDGVVVAMTLMAAADAPPPAKKPPPELPGGPPE